jgi:hypothetical protein
MEGKEEKEAEIESMRSFIQMASEMAKSGLIKYEEVLTKANELRTMSQENLSKLTLEIVEKNEKKYIISNISKNGFWFGLIFLVLILSCYIFEQGKYSTLAEGMGYLTGWGGYYSNPEIPDYRLAVLRLAHNESYIEIIRGTTYAEPIMSLREIMDRIATDGGIISIFLGILATGVSTWIFLSNRGLKRIISLISCFFSLYIISTSALWLKSISTLVVCINRGMDIKKDNEQKRDIDGFGKNVEFASTMVKTGLINSEDIFEKSKELERSPPDYILKIRKRLDKEMKIRLFYDWIKMNSFWFGLISLLLLISCYCINENQIDFIGNKLPEEYTGNNRIIHIIGPHIRNNSLFFVKVLLNNPTDFGEVGESVETAIKNIIIESNILMILMVMTSCWMWFINREREIFRVFSILLTILFMLFLCYRYIIYYLNLTSPM